jgi:hypothetical protein
MYGGTAAETSNDGLLLLGEVKIRIATKKRIVTTSGAEISSNVRSEP